MSYDIRLAADVGGDLRASLSVLDWNYTSNVAPMWRKAMPDTDGLAGLDGMLAGEAASEVRKGVARMKDDPVTYRQMNPENGWGDFDSQLAALERLIIAFDKAPAAFVEVSR